MLMDIECECLKFFNILLVDDFLIVCKQFFDVLDSINILYYICKNGSEVLDLMCDMVCDYCVIDILVSDIEMLGLDGYELVFEM